MAGFEAVLIAGPTASGKSAIALDLAQRIGGAVVNADSMQVYSDLRILTARPTRAEEAEVPHRLYGHVDGATAYSVGHWLTDAERTIDALRGERLIPVFVGGTGLYFRGLLEGFSPIPEIPQAVRARWRQMKHEEGTPALAAELARRDPDMARRLEPGDSQRILRALEVIDATGRSLADWQAEPGRPLLDPARVLRLFLDPDRSWLYPRIDARFEDMMAEGALDEVADLRARGLSPDLPVMRAHGVPHLIAFLDGRTDIETALVHGKADVRHYAKRQKTWFRGQMAGWTAAPPREAAAVLDRMLAA